MSTDTIMLLPPLQAALAVIFCLLALYRFLQALRGYIADPIKQARRYGMTDGIMKRSNVIILLYSFYLFYEFIMSLFQQPGPSEIKIAFDIVMKFVFAMAIFSQFGALLFDLHANAGLGGADKGKVRHLVVGLNKRGVYIIELCLVMPLLAALKYYAQGALPIVLNRFGL